MAGDALLPSPPYVQPTDQERGPRRDCVDRDAGIGRPPVLAPGSWYSGADRHSYGCGIIPGEIDLGELLRVAEQFMASERSIIEFARGSENVSIAELKRRMMDCHDTRIMGSRPDLRTSKTPVHDLTTMSLRGTVFEQTVHYMNMNNEREGRLGKITRVATVIRNFFAGIVVAGSKLKVWL